MRLGVYSDMVYRRDGDVVSNNRSFVRFITGLPPRLDEVVLFGRLHPEAGREAYVLPADGVRLVPLPYYRRAVDVVDVARSVQGACRTFARELGRLDAVWVFGPQPLSLPLAWTARRHGSPLVLGVRHDYPEYIRNRLPSDRWGWAVPVAQGMDRAFRRLSRDAPTVALGSALAARYSGGAPVLSTGFSLVGQADVRPEDEALARDWDDGPLEVATVSRLDQEKNPLLLLDILAELRRRSPRWRLTVAGDGPLRTAMEQRVTALGLGDAVTLRGEVPNGPELWELYRRSHVFLHVSLTEGLPQVLFEAQAAGIPIVATAVGGVPEALAGGAAGVLVPPRDAHAAAEALAALERDPARRAALIRAGLANAAEQTLEAQLDRVAEFVRAAADRS